MAHTETQPKKEVEVPELPVVHVRATGEWADFETGYVLRAITDEIDKVMAAKGLAAADILVSGLDATALEREGGFRGRKQRVINAVPLSDLPAIMTHANGDGRGDTRNPWSFATEDREGDPGLVLLDKGRLIRAEEHPDYLAHYAHGAALPADFDDSRPDDMWVTADDGPIDSPQNHALVTLLHFEGNDPNGTY